MVHNPKTSKLFWNGNHSKFKLLFFFFLLSFPIHKNWKRGPSWKYRIIKIRWGRPLMFWFCLKTYTIYVLKDILQTSLEVNFVFWLICSIRTNKISCKYSENEKLCNWFPNCQIYAIDVLCIFVGGWGWRRGYQGSYLILNLIIRPTVSAK